jgi:hypothetical protein
MTEHNMQPNERLCLSAKGPRELALARANDTIIMYQARWMGRQQSQPVLARPLSPPVDAMPLQHPLLGSYDGPVPLREGDEATTRRGLSTRPMPSSCRTTTKTTTTIRTMHRQTCGRTRAPCARITVSTHIA